MQLITTKQPDGRWKTEPARGFSGVTLRTPEQIAAILEICATCDRFTDGKCKLCRVCGGLRRVDDWARMSSHRCPDKKW